MFFSSIFSKVSSQSWILSEKKIPKAHLELLEQNRVRVSHF